MKTCLLVDDSKVIRTIARRMIESISLDSESFEILEAEDGVAALAICEQNLPACILLDWNMPVMDGFEFLKKLRAMPGGLAPKVVFCTTENDVSHIARALEAGADEYIMKPFDKDMIVDKFREVGLV
jgi:two-component system chemotaxis response regulator CheY